MGAGKRGRDIEGGDLPAGFLVAGSLGGMLKPKGKAVLPKTVWSNWVRIDAEQYRPYAQVCGFSAEQGVPLTWPYVLTFPLQMRLMMARDFPFAAMGTVHLSNHIRQEAQLFAGDELYVSCQAEALFSHPKGQVFSLLMKAERDRMPVWSSRGFYLKRGEVGQGPPFSAALADLPLGKLDHKIETIEADLKTTRRYARHSGDVNPIHTSVLLARVLGFPRPIAHGMWAKARALSALTEGRPVDAAEAEVSFRNPLLLPAKAELYAASSGTVYDFECRDSEPARTHLRGRLSLL